jgi:replicative DNA helicase
MNPDATETAGDTLRALPHALGPEKSILSTMLQDPREFIPAAIEENLTAAHFYIPAHSTLFEILRETSDAGEEIELVSLAQRLLDRGQLSRIGGPAALSDLYTYAPSPGTFRHHLRLVRDKFIHRELIRVSNETIAAAYDAPEESAELLDATEAAILAIRDSGSRSSGSSTSETVGQILDEIHRTLQGEQGQPGISTGFPTIDEIIGSMKAGEMIVIAARPSMGKTALAMNIIEAAAVDRGEPALVFSLEMSASALVRRLTFSRARIQPDAIKNEKGTLQRIQRAALEIGRSPLVIDDTPAITITALRAQARRLHRSKGIRLIAVDYLQLVKSFSRQAQASREREVSEVSQGLKALAKELALPIIVLAQLNRDSEKRPGRKVGRPRLSDLRESGAIEQDSDVVSLLYRPAYYAESEEEREASAGFAELIIAKNRNGPTGPAALTWIAELTRFESGVPIRMPARMPQEQQSRFAHLNQ